MFTALVPTLLLVVPAAPVPTGPAIPLPKDPNVVVIEFDHSGGFTLPPMNNKPALTITAGGTATVNNRFTGESATLKFTPAQVQELLKFIVTDNKFFEFDTAKVEKAIEEENQKNGPVPMIADAPNTDLMIKTADKEHKVSYYALGMAASQYETVEPIRQYHAIERRMNQAQSLVWAGGPAAVEGFLKLANAELKAKHPDAAPLTMADLEYARRQDNTLTTTFRRTNKAKKTFVYASVVQSDTGEPKVVLQVNKN